MSRHVTTGSPCLAAAVLVAIFHVSILPAGVMVVADFWDVIDKDLGLAGLHF